MGSWVLMSYFGRRTLYIAGLVALMFILIGIGGCGFAPPNATITQTKRQDATIRVNTGAAWGAGSLLLVFTLVYGKSISINQLPRGEGIIMANIVV